MCSGQFILVLEFPNVKILNSIEMATHGRTCCNLEVFKPSSGFRGSDGNRRQSFSSPFIFLKTDRKGKEPEESTDKSAEMLRNKTYCFCILTCVVLLCYRTPTGEPRHVSPAPSPPAWPLPLPGPAPPDRPTAYPTATHHGQL